MKPRIRVKAGSRPLADVRPIGRPFINRDDIDPNDILADAQNHHLIKAVICGIDYQGEFWVWTSPASNGDSLMLVERCKAQIIQCERDEGFRPSIGGEVLPFRRDEPC